MMFLAWSFVAPARNFVVCVGVSDYPDEKNDLSLPVGDANAIAVVYEKNGDARVKVLTDKKATLKKVLKAIGQMASRATSDDAVCFYFSGHGVPGGFVCYDGVIAYDVLSRKLLSSAAGTKIVIADACYSGMARNLKQYGAPSAETVGKNNVVFFLSSRTNEKSKEKEGWRNSIFTAYLERGLQGGADVDRDRIITVREIYNFVSEGVAKTSLDKQHPVMWGKFEDKMPLMKW